MTIFFSYIYEIQYRTWYLFLSFIFTFISAYCQINPILVYIVKPLKGHQLILTDISEFWLAILFLALYFSFFFTFPLILYNLWAFISPSLYKTENNTFWYSITISCLVHLVLFFCIIKWALPIIIQYLFLAQERADFLEIQCMPKLLSYITTIIRILLLIFGVAQLIICIVFLLNGKKQWITKQLLVEYRKILYIFILFISALFSPPDPLSQLCLSFFLFLNYEIIIIYSIWLKTRRCFTYTSKNRKK